VLLDAQTDAQRLTEPATLGPPDSAPSPPLLHLCLDPHIGTSLAVFSCYFLDASFVPDAASLVRDIVMDVMVPCRACSRRVVVPWMQ
jgi:hypothetical protein